jgi:hypothetical protein
MTYLRVMYHHLNVDDELISGSLLQMAGVLQAPYCNNCHLFRINKDMHKTGRRDSMLVVIPV